MSAAISEPAVVALPTTVSSEQAPMIQFVTPAGSLTDLGASQHVDLTVARQLYRDMARARRVDHEALALQRQGELGLWLMCWGQEAAQVGSIRALRDSDMVFPSYRDHAAALCRGITPGQLMAQWRGVSHAGWRPLEHMFHIYSLVLGTQTLHATGYAAGAVLEGADEVVMTYFGDGAASQGDVNEAFNWASVGQLPVLFFCQNNQWAISTPTGLQMRNRVHQRAAGFGLRTYLVDGNDALAVYSTTQEAASHIRSGGGPVLIEAETYRMAGHSSSDDPKRYRDEREFMEWEAKDPIARLEVVLRRLGTPDSWFERLDASTDKLAAEVRAACRALEAPDLDDLFDNVYAAPHPVLARQRSERAELLAELEGQ
jgi:2-oxoisovalerate dehydrogenase E1 component alpha subunit